MTRKRPFQQVDVFTNRPLYGNPVAVVFDADDMSDAEMQQAAAWTNLSETTFLCRPTTPDADYLLRIFHPKGELPFAGHPTIGSAHAALETGLVTKREFVMECGAGLLPLRVEGDGPETCVFVKAPRAELLHEFTTSVEALSRALGSPVSTETPPASASNGPVWLFCRMSSPDAIGALQPDMAAVARLSRDLGVEGLATFAFAEGADHAIRIRVFGPAIGVAEDPVTGSANASLPAYLARYDLLSHTGREYIASQGTEMGRNGRVWVRVLDDSGLAEIGGESVTVIEGEIRL